MSRIKSKTVSSKLLRGGTLRPPIVLSGLDIFNGHVGIPIVLAYPQGLDIQKLEDSLTRTLQHYPMACGRLKKDAQGVQYIDCNDAGVGFKVKRCSGKLPAYGANNPVGKDFGSYYTFMLPWQVMNRDTPLLSFEIYQFDDGGALLCSNGPHSLFDGAAFWQFMSDWSATAAGRDVQPPPADRDMLIELGKTHLEDRAAYRMVYDPKLSERLDIYGRFIAQGFTGIKKDVFRIPAQQIAQWKQDAKNDLPPTEGVSTSDLVAAHCMQVLSPLMPSKRDRVMGIVFDLRHKRRLRIPRNYCGNALGYGDASYTAQELQTSKLAVLARKCRPDPQDVSTEALQSLLGLMEHYRQKQNIWRLFMRPVGATLHAGLVLNNCSHFPIYDIDLGSGKPSWYDVCGVAFRMLMIVNTPENDGGVDIHLTARPKELERFRQLYQTPGSV